MNRTLFKLAASALVLSTVAIGCKPAMRERPVTLSSVAPVAGRADRLAVKAEQALKQHKAEEAIVAAEGAVALDPRNAGYRATLGRAYLAAGRFLSAETAFADARTLDPGITRAALGQALAQIALGDGGKARTILDGADGLSASDRGLAMALAGDPEGAIALLEPAVRTEGANAQTRQNLALAYGLAGQWGKAVTVAAVDTPRGELTQRIMEWNQIARPQTPAMQVATLLGTTPVADTGQPVALALVPVIDIVPMAAEPVQMAVAPVAPLTNIAPVEVVASADVVEPMQMTAVLEAVTQPLFTRMPAMRKPLMLASSSVRAPLKMPASGFVARQRAEGNFVVQLGAFSTAARAEAAWSKALGGMRHLSGFAPSSAVYRSGNATLHRLALTGFATRASAARMCELVKARGGTCFVRTRAGDAPVRWASVAAPRRNVG